MSTLTKVCIVVLVVIALVSAPVFITLANIVPNYRKAYLMERDEKLIAENNHRVAIASLNNMRAIHDRETAAKDAKMAGLQAAIADRDAQIKTAALGDVQMKAQLDSAQEATKREQTAVQAGQAIIKEQNTQLETKSKQITEKDNEIIALRKAKEDADAQATRDRAALRLALEQLAAADGKIREKDDKIERLMSGQKVVTAEPGAILQAGKEPVIGTITTVKGNLASVNVGKVKGIEKGMVLVIYRNDEYIGRLQIESVELDNAAGVVVDKKHEPKANDKVVSRIPLN